MQAIVLGKAATAEALSVSVRTVDRMLRDGQLPFVRVRGQVRIPITAIEKIVSSDSRLRELKQASDSLAKSARG
jgi:excisionase family DNA binding protein